MRNAASQTSMNGKSTHSLPAADAEPSSIMRGLLQTRPFASCPDHFRVPYSNDNIVSGGTTGIVQLLPCGHVRKTPFPHAQPYTRRLSLQDLQREAEIYRRLPPQTGIVRMIEYSPAHGVVLEFMEHGHLRGYLKEYAVQIPLRQRLRWACEAPALVHLLHSHGIIHCDLKAANFVLDPLLRLHILDFAGSSIDGCPSSVAESARFALPQEADADPSIETDLFALGSTLYEIMTGEQPYADVSEDEVTRRFKQLHFPILDDIVCGKTIGKCWRGEFKSAYEAQDAIEDELRDKRPSALYEDLLETFPNSCSSSRQSSRKVASA